MYIKTVSFQRKNARAKRIPLKLPPKSALSLLWRFRAWFYLHNPFGVWNGRKKIYNKQNGAKMHAHMQYSPVAKRASTLNWIFTLFSSSVARLPTNTPSQVVYLSYFVRQKWQQFFAGKIRRRKWAYRENGKNGEIRRLTGIIHYIRSGRRSMCWTLRISLAL